MDKKNNITDDYCDIYEKKICDNCGECLELEGVDTKAIKIEDIAKAVEENKHLEEELKKALENTQNDDEEIVVNWDKVGLEEQEEEYEDAFEHIEYIEDMDEALNDELQLEELTEELFPGVRKLKRKL